MELETHRFCFRDLGSVGRHIYDRARPSSAFTGNPRRTCGRVARIGRGLAEGVDFASCLLLASGRITSEILHKAVRCRVPVLVSRAAPTDRSVELARAFNLTLAGFARGRRMNLYSAPERILTGG